MSKRSRILLLALGVVALAAAIWIGMSLRNGDLTFTDDSVDIELMRPTG